MNLPAPLNTLQVAEALSVREFMALCRHFDQLSKKAGSEFLGGDFTSNGVPTQKLAGRVPTVQFDIYQVRRTASTLNVVCAGKDGKLIDLDCTTCMTKPKPERILRLVA